MFCDRGQTRNVTVMAWRRRSKEKVGTDHMTCVPEKMKCVVDASDRITQICTRADEKAGAQVR
jgi:hypothetical protein